MFGPIGMQELIIIFVIALIVFGPRKLPELGKSLGKSIAEFKRASNELRSTLEQEIRVEETRREVMEPIETVRREAQSAVDGARTVADSMKSESIKPEGDDASKSTAETATSDSATAATPAAAENDSKESSQPSSEPQETKA
jgi:TatA/E family protein of Tat protein translocase